MISNSSLEKMVKKSHPFVKGESPDLGFSWGLKLIKLWVFKTQNKCKPLRPCTSYVAIILTNLVIMGAVAFFTLLERKYLGYFQLRVGPNKVGLKGLPQPLADAIKLLLKEFIVPDIATRIAYILGPCIILILCVSCWVMYPVKFPGIHYLWSVLLFVGFSSAGVYGVLMVGWSSNSKYAYFGCVRAAAQFISYEVVILLIILTVIISAYTFRLAELDRMGPLSWLIFFLPLLMWLVSLLAETNRAPFDFVEGESELVSGFNVEYGGVGFAIIFIAEYSMILFIRIITTMLFFSAGGGRVLLSCTVRFFVRRFVILSRGALPRYRYDLLIGLTWKYILPIILAWLGLELAIICSDSLNRTIGWSPRSRLFTFRACHLSHGRTLFWK